MRTSPLKPRLTLARSLCVAALTATFVTGCASVQPVALYSSKTASNAQLLDAADRFYSATDAEQLEAARDEALKLAPNAALSHELAAQYALLRGAEKEATAHLMLAAADLDNPDAVLHLKLLFATQWSHEESLRIEGLLSSITSQHPSAEVRAYAAFRLVGLRRELGLAQSDGEAGLNGKLPLAIIGSWDNDQGKGFDIPQPPETDALDFTAEYPGVFRPVRWRTDVSAGPDGVYPLSELIDPSRFSVAYATGAFRLPTESRVELRLRTSDPFKVWVDGKLVATVLEVREVMFDQAVIPLNLPAGPHRVLIKSARREAGAWVLSARLTGERGAEIANFAALVPTEAVAATQWTHTPSKHDVLVDARLATLTDKRVRTLALTALWWRQTAGGGGSVREAEKYSASAKGSVYARWLEVLALWNNGEPGRASDILAPLATRVGSELTGIATAQARLWTQQGLRQNARSALISLKKKDPDNVLILRELSAIYDAEDWLEDECTTAEELFKRAPGSSSAASSHATCLQKMGKFEKAERVYLAQLKLTPGDDSILRGYMGWALERGREAQAEWAAREYVEHYPNHRAGYLSLAYILERREAYDEAKAVLAKVRTLAPDSATPWTALARLEYRRGEKDAAVLAWREALARNPDDEKLANRVEFLSPSQNQPWTEDVPDELELEKLVAKARALKPESGANYAFVLDHEVSEYKADGTVVSLVTEVLQSFNAEGRDALLKRHLGGGRVRMRVAYAVDQDGRRIEPASVRDGQVRFRSLGEKSTVVLQFRRDTSPRGYLARHLTYSWTFQGLSDQRERAQFILYAPKSIDLHEWLRGKNVERTEEQVGDLRRISWSANKVPPAGFESNMPTVTEVTSTLMLSSINSWDVFAKWNEAMFQDALRESPELQSLAEKLFASTDGNAPDAHEKLMRIQSFLMKEIRYEQDYESMIAGVKPHPAPMVLERKYGDCKDKTVLFMTLAKLGGLQAHYALIRTRDWGPVKTELPQQQFNHVIVYVPKQPGLPEGRYFDPTADALDLVSLRSDVVGTQSFVIDPATRTWKWQQVPFQTSDANNLHATVDLTLNPDGSGTARVLEALVGNEASSVRRLARNKEHFDRLVQHIATSLFAGGEVQGTPLTPDPDDVRSPAQFTVDLAARTAAKKEGDTLRLTLPRDFTPTSSFKLAHRRHPLVLSVPRRYRWSGVLKLANATVARAPEPVEFKSACLDYSRKVSLTAEGLAYDHAAELKCDRIEPSSYPEALKAAVEVQRLMEEDVVFSTAMTAPPTKNKKVGGKLPTVTRPAP